MRKFITITIAALFATTLMAQNADIPCTVLKSKVFKEDEQLYNYDVTSDGEGGLILLQYYTGAKDKPENGYCVSHYNAQLELVKKVKLPFSGGGRAIRTFLIDNRVYVIIVKYLKPEKSYVCQVLSTEGDDFKIKTTDLFKVKMDEVSDYDFQYHLSEFFNIYRANSGESFAITAHARKKKIYNLMVYDRDLNLKLEHKFNDELDDSYYEYVTIVPETNTAYLYYKLSTKESRKHWGYEHGIFRITDKGSNKKIIVDEGGHIIRELALLPKKNNIACVGFYSDQEREDSNKGIYYYELDAETLEVKTSKYSSFTSECLAAEFGEKKKKELPNLIMKKLEAKENGEIMINAEEYNYTPGINNVHKFDEHEYNNIIINKLSVTGDLVWSKNINKKQNAKRSSVSYSSLPVRDDMYLFLNAQAELKDLRDGRFEFNDGHSRKSNFAVFKIDEAGKMTYKNLFSNDEDGGTFPVAGGYKLKDNKMCFLRMDGKEWQIMTVTIN